MMHGEMTDSEVAEQLTRANRFIEALRSAISEAIASVDPHSLCADEQCRGLARIAATLDAVPTVTMCNLANV